MRVTTFQPSRWLLLRKHEAILFFIGQSLAAICLPGCGSPNDLASQVPPPLDVRFSGASELVQLATEFRNDALRAGVLKWSIPSGGRLMRTTPRIHLEFVSPDQLNPKAVAHAEKHPNNLDWTIQVRDEAWPNWDAQVRRAVMYHELGHALLRRPHDFRTTENGRPVSLMYPKLMKSEVIVQYWSKFLEELYVPQ